MAKKARILFVEDEKVLLELSVMILEGELPDVEILTANSGKEAIAILEQNADIDLILSDYNMPDGSGVDLYNFNKTHEKIPFILVSGGYLEDYSDMANMKQDNPLNDFISKPFDEDEFVSKVRNRLPK